MIERTFASLRVPNYRRYFTGQVISITGNWMQIVGEMWLMVKLTGSGVSVGLTAGLQFLPILLFGAWGGLLADRMSKRTLLTITQLSMAVPALTLFGLVAERADRAVDGARAGAGARVGAGAGQPGAAVVRGRDRRAGPGLERGRLELGRRPHCAHPRPGGGGHRRSRVFGISWCFLLNALSFLAMFVALRTMDPSKLQTPKPIDAPAR